MEANEKDEKPHPEVSLPISYYVLYAKLAAAPARIDNEEVFWVEDDWTERDELQARTLLEENKERCRVQSGRSTNDTTAWDMFYGQHHTNFFKDRYYLSTAFEEFRDESTLPCPCLVELGCGVGNAMLPLLEKSSSPWKVYGFDLSSVAIGLVREDKRFQAAAVEGRAFTEVGDLSQGIPESFVGVGSVASLLFCLSAIEPAYHVKAVQNAVRTLRPGGVVVFRDYGRFDEAQLKLATQRSKLLEDSFYQKTDGTKCYYFTLEEVERLFVSAGMTVLDLKYIRRVYKNRESGTTRRRVWIQGRFQKTS